MLLLSTSSLKGYGLHKIFILAKKAGYDGIDLTIEKLNYDSWDTEYIKSLSDAFKLPVLSLSVPDKGINDKMVDKFVQMATSLGSQVITFSPPHITDKNTAWFNKYLAKSRRDTRISLAIQNVESKFMLFIIPEHKNSTLSEIKRVTGDTTLSVSNIDRSSGMDLLKAQKILGSTVRNVYLSDRLGGKMGLLPGQAGGDTSHLPLESFLMKLRTGAYNGYISLKVRPSELSVGNDEKVLQNLEYVKNYYTKHYLDFKGN